MSVTPAQPVLSNPGVSPWSIATVIVVVVIVVPPSLLNSTLMTLTTLFALFVGASVPAVKYSNRGDRR
ncbi:hypothetical protein [Streptacidiphilus fuscans]|uniref:Uncharacterized protein n=1 Tax=Streptacidiphilus fuscans TaxID=2789292 RepID=A0A931FCR6_9ACTN|nr:hypothetical protein [Streptacidiphilus fuscans]MBF9066771.1 hypothetical protein [Streptacidiphilus fuscans]